jgi:hypothetical protein
MMPRMRRSARARWPSRPFTSANADELVGALPGGAHRTDEPATPSESNQRSRRAPADFGYFNAFVKNRTNAVWSAASTSGCSE